MATDDKTANASAAQDNDGGQPDYKVMYEAAVKESRKWEDRAKANKMKADAWDEASGGEASILDRLEKLEAENQAMKDAEARHALVAKVAAESGLTEAVVGSLSGTDEETLMQQAQAIAELKPKGAPSAPEAGMFPHNNTNTKSKAERFGDIIHDALSR